MSIVIILIVTVIVFLQYYGAFSKINITGGEKGQYQLVYAKFTGHYKDTGPVMDKIYFDLLNIDSVETYKGFGIYYDNPKEIEAFKCRSIVGCILEKKDLDKIEDLKTKYNIIEIPESESICAEFPYKGKISILVGIFKFYPSLKKYLSNKGLKPGPVMEIYDTPNEKINYIFAVDPKFPEFSEISE